MVPHLMSHVWTCTRGDPLTFFPYIHIEQRYCLTRGPGDPFSLISSGRINLSTTSIRQEERPIERPVLARIFDQDDVL